VRRVRVNVVNSALVPAPVPGRLTSQNSVNFSLFPGKLLEKTVIPSFERKERLQAPCEGFMKGGLRVNVRVGLIGKYIPEINGRKGRKAPGISPGWERTAHIGEKREREVYHRC